MLHHGDKYTVGRQGLQGLNLYSASDRALPAGTASAVSEGRMVTLVGQ